MRWCVFRAAKPARDVKELTQTGMDTGNVHVKFNVVSVQQLLTPGSGLRPGQVSGQTPDPSPCMPSPGRFGRACAQASAQVPCSANIAARTYKLLQV